MSETSDISTDILTYVLAGVLIATIVLGIMMLFQLTRLATFAQYYTSFTTTYGPNHLRLLFRG